jgi:hypothetical protein
MRKTHNAKALASSQTPEDPVPSEASFPPSDRKAEGRSLLAGVPLLERFERILELFNRSRAEERRLLMKAGELPHAPSSTTLSSIATLIGATVESVAKFCTRLEGYGLARKLDNEKVVLHQDLKLFAAAQVNPVHPTKFERQRNGFESLGEDGQRWLFNLVASALTPGARLDRSKLLAASQASEGPEFDRFVSLLKSKNFLSSEGKEFTVPRDASHFVIALIQREGLHYRIAD